jgi:hypothetical protein
MRPCLSISESPRRSWNRVTTQVDQIYQRRAEIGLLDVPVDGAERLPSGVGDLVLVETRAHMIGFRLLVWPLFGSEKSTKNTE